MPKVMSWPVAAAFSATISPTSDVPSLVGQFSALPPAVVMTWETSRMPPNAFSESTTIAAISAGTV
ncbi:hypothetical protein D3C87_1942050 [compost metagenome]